MGGQRRREIRGQEPLLEENGKVHANTFSKGGKFIVMDIALAIVDLLAGNQHPPARKNRTDWKCWKCGLTAGKERNYQRSSKGKLRRFVPADRVYYIQSAYLFQ